MHRLPAVLALIATLTATLVANPAVGRAATCSPLSPEQMTARADVVFTGTVTGSRVLSAGRWRSVQFSVEDALTAGAPPAVVAVRVPARGGCAPLLQTGRRYTVFARTKGDRFVADSASVVTGAVSPGRYGIHPPPPGSVDEVPPAIDIADGAGWVWLLIVLFVVVAVGGSVFSVWRKNKRRKELAFFAAQQGLSYSAFDPGSGVVGDGFELLHKGDGRGFENFMTGTWKGMEVVEFDYWYYDESTDSKGRRSRTYYRFSCAMLGVDALCPTLTIGRESIFGRLADHLGFHDIEFESEEFNRRYSVKSPDPRFASAFVDQRMMKYLMGLGNGWAFGVAGDRALVWSDRLRPNEVIMLLGVAKGFSEHVPRVVSSLYARGGGG